MFCLSNYIKAREMAVASHADDEGWSVVSTKRNVVPTPAMLHKLKRGMFNLSDSSEVIVNSVNASSSTYRLPSYLRETNYDSLFVLGIGPFGSSIISKTQLVLARQLLTCCKPRLAFCYDPVLSLPERSSLIRLGFQFNPDLMIADGKNALLFMPHCDKSLYLQVLRDNRHRLDRISLIGNDFRIYALRSSGDEGWLWTELCKYISVKGFFVSPALPPETLSDTVFTEFPVEHLKMLASLLC